MVILRKHLEAAFAISDDPLPSENEAFNEEIHDVYRSHYDKSQVHLWASYINWFTIDEITNIIKSLDPKMTLDP